MILPPITEKPLRAIMAPCGRSLVTTVKKRKSRKRAHTEDVATLVAEFSGLDGFGNARLFARAAALLATVRAIATRLVSESLTCGSIRELGAVLLEECRKSREGEADRDQERQGPKHGYTAGRGRPPAACRSAGGVDAGAKAGRPRAAKTPSTVRRTRPGVRVDG